MRLIRMKALIRYAIAVVVAAGNGTVFAQPAGFVAGNKTETAASASAAALPAAEPWWTVFGDPLLDSLEGAGQENNLDLQVVVSRVEEARARVKVAQSYWFPSVRLEPSVTTQSLAPNRPLPLQVQDDQQISRFQLNTFQLPLTVSYEVDLWQRIRGEVRTNTLLLESTEAEYMAARLTITAEIARTYLLLRSTDAERAVLRRGIGLRDSTLGIVEARYQAGLVSEMDVQRAETETANARFQLQALDRSRAELELSLAVLLGAAPGSLRIGEGGLPDRLPVVPATLPADLTFRRPDLVQSERLVAAAKTQVKISKTALLPRLSVQGSAGFVSRDVTTLLAAESGTYLAGAGIAIPIFEGHRNRNAIVVAQKQAQTASLTYQQRVLTATQEVETTLANLQILSGQTVTQQRALQSAQRTRRYARELYLKGLTSFLEAVDAERTALELERQAANLKGQQALYTVDLIRALGGNW